MSEKSLPIVMSESRTERYVVVAIRWIELCPEIVITYCDGALLRALTARNIIGIALTSSQAVVANITTRSSRGADPKKLLENPINPRGDSDRKLQSLALAVRSRFGLTKILRIIFETLQRGVAAGTLMFFSSNIVAVLIRVLVGA